MKMNLFQTVVMALALSASSVFGAAMPGAAQGKATVKVISGTATYQDANGGGVLKTDQELTTGATINTGPGSTVVLDLGDNGQALSLKPDSTLKIDNLSKQNTGADAVINTQLDLKKGSAVGNVKKLSKASTYEIKTANGVAGIRGTSFHIFAVGIFRCASGALIVHVTEILANGQPGQTVNITVPAGREFTPAPPAPQRPGEVPRPAPAPVLIQASVAVTIVNEVNVISQIVNIPIVTAPTANQPSQTTQQQIERAVQQATAAIVNANINNQETSRTTPIPQP